MRFNEHVSLKIESKKRIRLLSVGIKYSMRDLTCDVINYCVWSSCDVGSISWIWWYQNWKPEQKI